MSIWSRSQKSHAAENQVGDFGADCGLTQKVLDTALLDELLDETAHVFEDVQRHLLVQIPRASLPHQEQNLENVDHEAFCTRNRAARPSGHG